MIYVNAGVTHLAETWLDALAENGRLLVPLTTDANCPAPGEALDLAKAMSSGAYFRIQRCGVRYLARWLLPTAIIPAQGARDSTAEAALAEAFAKGGWQEVTRFVRHTNVPDDRCWLKTHVGCQGGCLTYD